jgi:hypothetical protein
MQYGSYGKHAVRSWNRPGCLDIYGYVNFPHWAGVHYGIPKSIPELARETLRQFGTTAFTEPRIFSAASREEDGL